MKELCFEANLLFNYLYELSRLCCTNKPLLRYENCSSECEKQGRFQAGWSEAMRVDYSQMTSGYNFRVKIDFFNIFKCKKPIILTLSEA